MTVRFNFILFQEEVDQPPLSNPAVSSNPAAVADNSNSANDSVTIDPYPQLDWRSSSWSSKAPVPATGARPPPIPPRVSQPAQQNGPDLNQLDSGISGDSFLVTNNSSQEMQPPQSSISNIPNTRDPFIDPQVSRLVNSNSSSSSGLHSSSGSLEAPDRDLGGLPNAYTVRTVQSVDSNLNDLGGPSEMDQTTDIERTLEKLSSWPARPGAPEQGNTSGETGAPPRIPCHADSLEGLGAVGGSGAASHSSSEKLGDPSLTIQAEKVM